MKLKHYLLLALFLLPSFSRAASGINIELQDAKLPEIVQLFMQSVFKAEYVISPEVKAESKTLTVSLKNKTPDQAKSLFIQILKDYKIHLENRADVYFVVKDVRQELNVTPQHVPLNPVRAENPSRPVLLPESPSSTHDPVDISDLVPFADIDYTFYEPVNVDAAKIVDLLKFIGVSALNIDGKLLFKMPEGREDYIKSLIADFDKTKPDLVIKASIYEYQKNQTDQSAVEAVLNLLKNILSISLPVTNLTGAARIAINSTDLPIVFKMLNSSEHFRNLSSPTLRATDDKPALINVGASVPVLSQIVTNATGQTQQSVQYRDSGITLQVTPKIRPENIELNILQSVSDFTQTTTGVNQTPTLLQRKLETTLNCRDGDLILLGGLEQSKNDRGRTSFGVIPTGAKSSSSSVDLLLVLHVSKI
ncbi:type II secretion system protein GspD [Methylophilus glucosoxydans]|uniref:Type II secretion system protein GspD n=1 Tax=Methylophilus glucosoxydans TaxID=752553 RepID=A0ABW3GN76_9PROT